MPRLSGTPTSANTQEFEATARPITRKKLPDVHRIAHVRVQAGGDQVFGVDLVILAAADDVGEPDGADAARLPHHRDQEPDEPGQRRIRRSSVGWDDQQEDRDRQHVAAVLERKITEPDELRAHVVPRALAAAPRGALGAHPARILSAQRHRTETTAAHRSRWPGNAGLEAACDSARCPRPNGAE